MRVPNHWTPATRGEYTQRGTGWGEEWRFTRLGRRRGRGRGRGRFIVSLWSSFDCCHWDKATQQEML